ncbi:universal stress protein [Chamaesiphon sp. VAR_48_metabat_135_sub]|uniref:universal stress protein n=1 Tax=Chamaesiphon sp. VAR_48_metabat_135_sub TaxID=2964699 RepID=UPI00286C9430|nr:universal stress protein [Chamaesiphon sp. VAR_48_metabat_135_sub]
MILRTVLVALDESARSQQVIDAIENLQLSAESKVILCHVLANDSSQFDLADLPHQYAREIPYRQVEKQLQLYQQQLPCHSEIEIVTGEPVTEILRLAHIYHCDLIAIGCRGLTGVSRIVQGSISSQVFSEAPCSVLVVRN